MELIAVTVTRLQNKFAGQLNEIWKFVGRKLLGDTFYALGEFGCITERQVDLL